MLYSIILIIHILVCFGVILIVLLQAGKGAGLSSAFGVGGGESFFGGRGPALFLEKLTTGCAVLFMITCLSLSLYAMKRRGNSGSVLDKVAVPAATAPAAPVQTQVPAAAPGAPAAPAAPAPAPTTPAK
ncbi:MAG: preprotein translocase subunit SecG [bacterium]